MSLYLGENLISGMQTTVDKSERIGQIIQSTIPLSDAGLHLLDGALISGGGIYDDFVTYMATLSSSNPECFDTEANWQAAVAANGVCGKFVYTAASGNNPATVRLPKYSNKIYTSTISNNAPVKGNGITIGFTDGTLNAGAVGVSGSASRISATSDLYGTNIGTTSSQGFGLTNTTSVGITTDGTKSGIIADLANITTSLDGYYYIVVATTTKTEIEVDIDEIATDLNGKADVDLTNVSNTSGFRKLVEIYNNGADWYKVYSEYNPSTGVYVGQWCEQGGVTSKSNQNSISLLKNYANTNYSVQLTGNDSAYNYVYITAYNKSTSSFTVSIVKGTNAASSMVCWYACGYLAAT